MKRVLAPICIPILAMSIAACAPVNIFSPFVDPSKLDNDAKMEAGFNAIEDGDYDGAVAYFSDVISSTSGDEQADAYVGRAAAYLYLASPQIDTVLDELISGEISVDNPSELITSVVQDGDYSDFFVNVRLSADDFNAAMALYGSGADPGLLLETYQTNMMAATGIGADPIAAGYNTPPWDTATVDEEYGAIADENSPHPYNISTWDAAASNGLAVYVNGTPEETEMLHYLSEAFDDLTLLEPDPPAGMTGADVLDMKNNLNEWVVNGLGEPPFV